MIERIYRLPEGVVGLRATGEVTKEDYQRIVEPLFEDVRARGEPIRFLFLFPEGFERFTAGAAWQDAKVGMRYLRLLERCAVVTHKRWLRNAVRAMALVAPTRLHVYDLEDLDEALAWLEAKGEGSTLTHHILQNRGVLVLEPHDELHMEDFDRMATLVDPWIEQGDLAGVVVHVKRFPGWDDLAGMVQHLRFVRQHHREVPRVALAVDGAVAKLGPALARHFVQAELRRFAYDDVEAAIDWVSGDDLGILGEQIAREEDRPVAS